MKTALSIILAALAVSMMFSAVPAVFADSQLDSLVNIATQARTQVKLQLDRTGNVPSDIKALYDQGNSETELLINSVKQQDVEQSKQHFLSAMRIFKQVSMTFSPTATKVAAPQVQQPVQAPASNINYKASIARMESYISTLKELVAKNNISVDFTNLDESIQDAKDNIARGNMTSVANTYDDLKTAITDTQNLIKEKTNQKLLDKAKSFANEYIVKIDMMIDHAKELGISDDDVATLKRVKESLSTTNDPSQIVIRVQRIITINVELNDSKNQKTSEMDTHTVPADLAKTENASRKVMPADQNMTQEPKKETKAQADKPESKPANPDSNPAQNITTNSGKTDAQNPTDSGKADAKNPSDSSKNQPKQKRSKDQKDR